MKIPELYFKTDTEWRDWLHQNHDFGKWCLFNILQSRHENDSMRWEEAVKVALCYGWIDSTVKSLGDGKRTTIFYTSKHKKCLECFK